MTVQTQVRRVGDTRTVLPVKLVQDNESGTETVVNLTGLSVQFRMVHAESGLVKIATTSTGVAVNADPTTGKVDYTFSADGCDTEGTFWGTFIVTQTGATDTFPVAEKGLKIVFHDSPDD